MNTLKSTVRLSSVYPTRDQLAHYDREARRLRAEFAGDALIKFFIAFDQLIRRVATRLFG